MNRVNFHSAFIFPGESFIRDIRVEGLYCDEEIWMSFLEESYES